MEIILIQKLKCEELGFVLQNKMERDAQGYKVMEMSHSNLPSRRLNGCSYILITILRYKSSSSVLLHYMDFSYAKNAVQNRYR